jgi:hypothetical protein
MAETSMPLKHEIVAYDRATRGYRAARPIADEHVAAVRAVLGLALAVVPRAAVPLTSPQLRAIQGVTGCSFSPVDCELYLETYEGSGEDFDAAEPRAVMMA